MPLFGNKVIAVHEGLFDMHGVVRTPTWTSLAATAEEGTDVITLEADVDWIEGE